MSVVLAPGWMRAVCFSIPCPSTSRACGMLPPLVTAFDLVEDAMDVLAEAFAEAAG